MLLLAIILLAALGLRLWRIDAQSIWYDEGWSIHLAQEPLANALEQIASPGHTHPPGYYLLLMGWVRLFGGSVLAVRGLSAVIGVATVWAVYALTRDTYDSEGAGLIAAALAALAPAHVVYSQEARMYALMGLCLTLLLWLGYRYVHRVGRWTVAHWAALVLCEALAIYTHYFMAFPLLALNLWALGSLSHPKTKDRILRIARWLGAQAITAATFVPWLGVALRRSAEHETQGAMPLSLFAFLQETGTFWMGGHIALLGREPRFAQLAALALIATMAVALGTLLWRRRALTDDRAGTAFLLSQIVIPLGLVFLLMRYRPGYHPRYLLMLLLPLLALLGYGIHRLWQSSAWTRISAFCLVGLWLGASALGAHALYTDPYYHRDEARATAAYLRETLPPDALVLVPTDDWALRYYLQGSGLEALYLEMDHLSPQEAVAQPAAALAGRRTAALVRWHQGMSDYRGVLPYMLERLGAQTAVHHLPGYTVIRYELDGDVHPTVDIDDAMHFEGITLLDASVETDVDVDDAVAVALTFATTARVERPLKASLQLLDRMGRVMMRQDTPLRNRVGDDTTAWPLGRQVQTMHILDLEPGLAPVTYTVDLGIYVEGEPEGLNLLDEAGAPAGKRATLDTIHLAPSEGGHSERLDREQFGLVALASPVTLVDGLALAAHTMPSAVYDTGRTVTVLLEWQHVGQEALPDLQPVIQLVRDGTVLAAERGAPVYGDYPTDRWRPGDVVLGWRSLQVPLDAQEGPAELQVTVDAGKAVRLGDIIIHQVLRTFEPPSPFVSTALRLGDVAELVGYDLGPDPLLAGEDVSLTLYWRALGTPDTGYVVFTHLLDESGALIAQHDGPPSGGSRPTDGWLANEYVRDAHTLQWLKTDYRGMAVVEVGLYDPATGARLTTPEGDSRLLLGDGTMVR